MNYLLLDKYTVLKYSFHNYTKYRDFETKVIDHSKSLQMTHTMISCWCSNNN